MLCCVIFCYVVLCVYKKEKEGGDEGMIGGWGFVLITRDSVIASGGCGPVCVEPASRLFRFSNFQSSTEQGLVLKIPSDAVGEFGSEWGNGVGGVS